VAGTGVSIESVTVNNGTRIDQDGDGDFQSQDGRTLWFLTGANGPGFHEVRQFRVNVTNTSLEGSPSAAAFAIQIESQNATAGLPEREIRLFETSSGAIGVEVRKPLPGTVLGTCTAPVNDDGRATVYLSAAHVGNDDCPALDFFSAPWMTPYKIQYQNADNVEGVYELFADNRTRPTFTMGSLRDPLVPSGTPQLYFDDGAGDDPYIAPAVYNATADLSYTSQRASVRGNVSVEPEGLASEWVPVGTALRPLFPDTGATFSIPVGDAVSYIRSNRARTLSRSGTETTLSGPLVNLNGIGPFAVNLDTDAPDEVPFTGPGNSGRLQITDASTAPVDIANDVTTDPTVLAVGEWQGGDPSVFYAADGPGGNPDEIKEATMASGTATDNVLSTGDGTGVRAIAGPADIDGDNADEIVYIADNDNLKFLDDTGAIQNIAPASFSSGTPAIGSPGDYEGNGQARLPIVAANNQIRLVSSGGSTTSITSPNVAAEAPLATIDWDTDGELEIVFINDCGGATCRLRYVDDIGSSPTVKDVTNGGGSFVFADPTYGVR
jgi:hypothetical protein